MLLKKQTVWLLTMLSLVVVLSVYYITSPEQQGSNLAGVEDKETTEDKETSGSKTDGGDSVISSIASDEVFEALRMDLEDQRSKLKEELTEIMASTDLPAEKRSEAYDDIKHLEEVARKEKVLETLIRAMDYEDVLVRADGAKVLITIKAKEHSPAEANEIIQMVRTELGSYQPVAVEFQPGK